VVASDAHVIDDVGFAKGRPGLPESRDPATTTDPALAQQVARRRTPIWQLPVLPSAPQPQAKIKKRRIDQLAPEARLTA
jgi:hypothetical protein